MQLLHINVMAYFQPSHRPTASLQCRVSELRLLSQELTLQWLGQDPLCTGCMFVEWQTLGHNQTSKISLLNGLFKPKYCSIKTKHWGVNYQAMQKHEGMRQGKAEGCKQVRNISQIGQLKQIRRYVRDRLINSTVHMLWHQMHHRWRIELFYSSCRPWLYKDSVKTLCGPLLYKCRTNSMLKVFALGLSNPSDFTEFKNISSK